MSGKEKYASQQPQLLKTLDNLLKLPENRECVDCSTKAPRWASTNLGIFMCIRCSGIHRKLGVHISKVKSVSLDSWTPEQVEYMGQMGNANGKQIYEAFVPSTYSKGDILNDSMALEQWIRDKYDRKRFMGGDGAEPTTRQEYKDQKRASSNNRDYRDNSRDSYRDNNRDTYRDNSRDAYRDNGSRDSYRDNSRDTYRDNNRDTYRDDRDSRDSRDASRDSYREQTKPVSKPAQAAPLQIRAPSSSKQNPAPVTAPVAAPQESFDLLNWDAPARSPQEVQAAPAQNQGTSDFFGDFNSAAPAQTTNAAVAAPPQKDKSAILQLYNAPPMMPTYGMPPVMHQPVYPGANYNVQMQGGYPPNMYMHGMQPNYNMMGRGMAMPNYQMGPGPMGGVPPNQYGYGQQQQYGGQPGYNNNNNYASNPNNLVNGLTNLNLRM